MPTRIAPGVPIKVVEPAEAAAAFRTALPVVDLGIEVTAQPGRPDRSSAPAAIAAIRRAVADVQAGAACAVVTNPVAKNVLYRSGFAEPGHTEYLAKLAEEHTGVAVHPVMMLWSPELAVVPVTIHLPLKDVVGRLTADLIVETGRIVAHDLRDASALRIRGWRSRVSIRMPARKARSARRISRSSRRRLRGSRPTASTRAGRCRPTPCSMPPRARATTQRSPCITTRR